MLLIQETFISEYKLTEYVNDRGIKKNNVESIIFNEEKGVYALFYWGHLK